MFRERSEENKIYISRKVIVPLIGLSGSVAGRMSKSGSVKDGEKGPYDPVPTTDKANDEIKLEAKMSLLNGITVIVGSIIGSGIFVSPTGVLKYTGSVNASLLVWTASGIFSTVRTPSFFLEIEATGDCSFHKRMLFVN